MTIFLAIYLIRDRHPVPALALLPLLLFPLFGYLFGIILWNYMEEKYLAARAAARKEHEQIAALDALAAEVKELRESLIKPRSRPTPPTENGITELED
jgi:hypothetical protein